jgi:type IV pilus assembly protein PilB
MAKSKSYKGQMERLGEILVRDGRIVRDQLEEALKRQKEVGKRIGEVLIEMGYLSEQEVIKALGEQGGYVAVDEERLVGADIEAVRLVPELFAREYHVLPIERTDSVVTVAMSDPDDIVAVDNLRKLTGLTIQPQIAATSAIDRAIDTHFKEIRKSGEVDQVLEGLDFVIETDTDDDLDINRLKREVDDAPIVRLVNILLTEAIKERATDIHVEPMEDRLVVRYRIDGVLQEVMTPPKQSQMGIISRIKIMSKMNIAERRLPQDGRFTMKTGEKEVDVRVSVLPTTFGEKIVMRLLDKSTFSLTLENLGFEQDMLRVFRRWILMPYGMIIISGPTGSGKSTTLYAALNEIRSMEDNITTVEEPVEYQLDGINQVNVNTDIGLSFGAALRHIVRQDPDKLLIGEIRDAETADVAVKFSLTGHLVFSTVHANDAPSTITRLLDIGVPRYLVGSCLNLVMAQRLVRTICKHCKEEYKPSDEELERLRLERKQIPNGKLSRGKGCAYCRQTGYYGRTGIFEILEVRRPVRRVIYDGGNEDDIRAISEEVGMITLRDSALRKLFDGKTSAHEILRSTVDDE